MKKNFKLIEMVFQLQNNQFRSLEFPMENILISIPLPEEYVMGRKNF
ncbi:hypothetical protein [Salinimicrobium marinum]|nr:hypothetical protein [Salinimicrobium marinum]